jgi:intein-encoded DNA endonuclease-like protein
MGGIFKAQGSIYEAQAAQGTYLSKAQSDEYNATVATNNAQVANEQSNAQQEAALRKFHDTQGKAYAAVAQSGAGFDGSNADILQQNEVNSMLDQLAIRYDGASKSRGLIDQAAQLRYSAKVNRINADMAMKAGKAAATAALFDSASQMYKMSQSGGSSAA